MAVLGNGRDPTSQEKLEKIYRHANDAILVVDPDTQTITDCNPQACEVFECSREQLLDMEPSKLVSEGNHSCQEVYTELQQADGNLTDELSCRSCQGTDIKVELSLSSLRIDGEPRMLALIRDRTQIRRQREQLQKRSAAMEATSDGIAIIADDGSVEYANQAFAGIFGYDDAVALHGRKWRSLYEDEAWEQLQTKVLPTVRETGQWRGELRGQRRDGTTVPQSLSVAQLDGGEFVCSVRDISERKEHAATLESLSESARNLIAAEDRDAIAQIATDIVDDILGFDVGCVRLFDSKTNTLEPISMTERARTLIESCQAFDLDLSAAGRAYRRGTRIERTKDDVAYPDRGPTARVHFPLSQYGTLSVFSDSPSIRDLEMRYIEILAADITTALERTEREEALRKKKRELSQQRSELETINEVNQLVQQLIQQLVDTGTEEEVYRTVCDRIAASDFCESAWIGTVEPEAGTVLQATGTGVSDEYLALIESIPLARLADGIVAEAIRTQSIQVVRQYKTRQIGGDEEPQTSEATMAVPLSNDSRVFGVLVVTSTQNNAFSDTATNGFRVLSDVIGFTIRATLNRELLHSDTVTELEFKVTDPQCLPIGLSEHLGCQIQLEGMTQRSGGKVLCYLHADRDTPDDVVAVTDEMEMVEACRIVDERDDGLLLEVIASMPLVQLFADIGASIPTVIATDGEARIVVEGLPGTSREIVQAFDERYENVDLLTKREVNRPVNKTGTLREHLEETLTDRQRTVIEAAFTAGYYEWPRKSSAEELADAIGIAASTLHQHLRKAERKILESVLGDPQPVHQSSTHD